MKILIADDEFTSRKILMKIMEPFGECDIACNGKEAWDAFQFAHKEGRSYDILLLDIIMPEMDGRQVLTKIREYEKAKNLHGSKALRIAMATTLGDKESVITSFRDQCDGYMVKPYFRDSLLENLRNNGILPAS